MATVRLHAGAVADIGTTFGSGGTLVGSGAVWDDASDSTYLESKTSPSFQTGQAEAQLDTLTLPAGATVTGIRVNVRVQLLAASQTPAHLGIIIWPSSRLSPQLGLSVPNTDLNGWLLDPADQGSIVDLTDDVDATQYGNSFTDLDSIVALLESGTAYITALARPIIFPSTNLVQVRVYELSVDVTYTAPCSTDLTTSGVYQELDPFQGDIWSDSDDGTFTVQYGDDGPSGGFDNYAGGFVGPYTKSRAVFGATIHVRISGTRTDGLPDPIHAEFDLIAPQDPSDPTNYSGVTYGTSTDLFDVPADGTIYDIDVPLVPADLVAFQAALGDTPAVELYFDSWGGLPSGSANRVLTVYEVSMTVYHECGTAAIPPLQLVNRRDAFSSAPSLVNAGFHRQGGNRLTGPI